jgi:hypothetical protein
MKMRRAISGSIVALLLAVTSMAAACDLSCAFALANSDCHSSESPSQISAQSGMDMGGMDMSGMAMSGMNDAEVQPSTSGMSHAKSAHPSIGDMGPCERQSCDKGSFVFVKAGGSAVQRVEAALPPTQFSLGDAGLQIFRGARDDVAPFASFHASSLNLILRI